MITLGSGKLSSTAYFLAFLYVLIIEIVCKVTQDHDWSFQLRTLRLCTSEIISVLETWSEFSERTTVNMTSFNPIDTQIQG